MLTLFIIRTIRKQRPSTITSSSFLRLGLFLSENASPACIAELFLPLRDVQGQYPFRIASPLLSWWWLLWNIGKIIITCFTILNIWFTINSILQEKQWFFKDTNSKTIRYHADDLKYTYFSYSYQTSYSTSSSYQTEHILFQAWLTEVAIIVKILHQFISLSHRIKDDRMEKYGSLFVFFSK